jgi:DNA-binding transcriptional regulator YiaG
MTAFVCWEDAIAPTDISDVIAARDAALAEQRAAIQALRAEIGVEDRLNRREQCRAVRIAEARGWNAERLTALRSRLGITQEELASRLNITRDAVGKWERGAALPRREISIRLDQLEADHNASFAPRWNQERVRALRDRIGMSQIELGSVVGVAATTISHWEQGRVPVSSAHNDRLDEIDRDYPTVAMLTGEEIRAIRQRAGIGVPLLARLLGIDQSTIYAWERGVRTPDRRITRAIRAFEQRLRDEVAA